MASIELAERGPITRGWKPVLALALLVACTASENGPVIVFTGARIIDGTGAPPMDDAVLIVRDGRIDAVGSSDLTIPAGTTVVDLTGTTIVPGFINTHGHVGDTARSDSGAALRAELVDELLQYARYGITTVNSLGGEGLDAVAIRSEQGIGDLKRARLYVAGAVVSGTSPEAANHIVDANAALGVDFIKIRVDDNLGTSTKM